MTTVSKWVRHKRKLPFVAKLNILVCIIMWKAAILDFFEKKKGKNGSVLNEINMQTTIVK